MGDLALAGLLCARICHDIAGAIGAIGNGIELLDGEDDAAERAELSSLLTASARLAASRLRFFRLVWAGGPGQAVATAAEARAALAGLFAAAPRPVALDWAVTVSGGPPLRLLLSLAQIAGEALPGGGAVRIEDAGVIAAGPGAALGREVIAALAPGAPLALAAPAFARALAHEIGLAVAVAARPDSFSLTLAPA